MMLVKKLNFCNKRTNMINIFKKKSFNNDEKSEILLKMNKLYWNQKMQVSILKFCNIQANMINIS